MVNIRILLYRRYLLLSKDVSIYTSQETLRPPDKDDERGDIHDDS